MTNCRREDEECTVRAMINSRQWDEEKSEFRNDLSFLQTE